MAGDWIKMRNNLWDDPRVSRLCDLTDQGEAPIVGALYWLWAMADQHTEDGILPGQTLRQIDRKTGISGFGNAMCEIGWLEECAEGVKIIRFEEHNGSSAKRRSLDAQRKASVRNLSASDADVVKINKGQNAPDCGAREREREELTPSANADGLAGNDVPRPSTPACPHQDIIAAFHELLPMGTQVRVWTGQREKHLQARWREDAKRQSVIWWRKFFAYVSQSEFLTGRAQGRDRDPFVVSLDWLVNPSNFAKVIEGRYHREAA